MTGSIRPADTSARACSTSGGRSAGSNCTCSIPARSAIAARPRPGSIWAKEPLGAPCAENRPPGAMTVKASCPICPPTPFQDHVRSGAPGFPPHYSRPVRCAVVDRLGSQAPEQFQLALAAGRGQDMATRRDRQLDQQDAQPAAAPGHQHPLARADRGVPGQGQRGRAVVQQAQPLPQEFGIAGYLDQSGLADDRALGIAALRAWPQRSRPPPVGPATSDRLRCQVRPPPPRRHRSPARTAGPRRTSHPTRHEIDSQGTARRPPPPRPRPAAARRPDQQPLGDLQHLRPAIPVHLNRSGMIL